jgi:hypothetical protein
MVFGHPEPFVPKALNVACKIGGVAQGSAGIATLGDRGEIED